MNNVDEIDRIYSNINNNYNKFDILINKITYEQHYDRNNLFIKINNNIVSSVKNKFIELNNIFKDNNIDFYNNSILKFIIEKEFMNILDKAYNYLHKYYLELNIYFEHQISTLSFITFKRKNKNIDKNKINSINDLVNKYEKLNELINNYNLEDNIINNIIRFIKLKGHKKKKKNIGDISIIEEELKLLNMNEQIIKLEKFIKDKGYIDLLPNSDCDHDFLSIDDIKVIKNEINISVSDQQTLSYLKRYLKENDI